jgi:hypothetical protein
VRQFRSLSADETNRPTAKPFSSFAEDVWKQAAPMFASVTQQRGSVMWSLINALYREYCRARLAEMRRFELIR